MVCRLELALLDAFHGYLSAAQYTTTLRPLCRP